MYSKYAAFFHTKLSSGRVSVIPATQCCKITSKVAATIFNETQQPLERKITTFFLVEAEIEVKLLFGKHNLSNKAVVVGRAREVGRLLAEAQWSAAQRGVQFSAIPSALG